MKELRNKSKKPLSDTKTVSIRMPRAIHGKLLVSAKKDKRSLSAQCLIFLEQGVVHQLRRDSVFAEKV